MIFYTKKLIVIPERVLIISKINIIFNVSLKSLFFKSTINPKPALERSPLITAPKEIVPFISNIVKPIEIAQFGIKPTKEAITGCINFPP